MLKFQFMTIRTNVTGDTTKVTNMNKFKNINIPNNKSIPKFWFLPQQRTIWSNMTNNTTKVTSRHNNRFIMTLTVGLDISLETSVCTSKLLPFFNLAK